MSALGVGVNVFSAALTCCGVSGAHVHLAAPRAASFDSTDASGDEEDPDDREICAQAEDCVVCTDDHDDDDPRPAAQGVGVGRTALAIHLIGDAATCVAVLAEALFLRYGRGAAFAVPPI